MSVSDMNVSWSTVPSNRSSQYKTATDGSIGFHTSTNNSTTRAKRPKCVSAKNSGMRFQSWREPKPLRSRCNSAVVTDSVDRERDLGEDRKVIRSAGRAPMSARREPEDRAVSPTSNEDILARLAQPTASSKWKTTKARAREVGTDMNYYSWSRMNVYKAYQGVIYGPNGTTKRPTANSIRR